MAALFREDKIDFLSANNKVNKSNKFEMLIVEELDEALHYSPLSNVRFHFLFQAMLKRLPSFRLGGWLKEREKQNLKTEIFGYAPSDQIIYFEAAMQSIFHDGYELFVR